MKKKIRTKVINLVMITVGSLCYAAGIALFLEPNDLAPGGVSGLSIIIHELFPVLSTGTWIIIFNLPILALGVYKFGIRFFITSIYSVALSSLAINVLSKHIGGITKETLLACVAGSVLVAFGLGLVFKGGATTGGADIIVKLLRLKLRHIDTGMTFLVIDSAIVALSGLVFKSFNIALYAEIAVFIQMLVINFTLYGSDEARLIYIISDKKDLIAERLLAELDTGATFLKGTGAYTGDEKQVLMCVLKMRSLPKAKDIVASFDLNAFMVVTRATSVFGEGFKAHGEEEL
ncbi:MAG: hypothetical protein BWY46_00200 [Firmicutes bacterium ADurb.Bin300]|nr:MAG: hypothetical protein BWY46_00200 [Firmicutes bacterium ADurb.Bin300]